MSARHRLPDAGDADVAWSRGSQHPGHRPGQHPVQRPQMLPPAVNWPS